MDNIEPYNPHDYINGNRNHIDPSDMATDEDAVERKKVSLFLIETKYISLSQV